MPLLRRTLVVGALGAALAVGIHLAWGAASEGAGSGIPLSMPAHVVRDVVYSPDVLARASESPADAERVANATSRRALDAVVWTLVAAAVAAIVAAFCTRLAREAGARVTRSDPIRQARAPPRLLIAPA